MSETDYPALGFDPLPGDPEALQAMIERTRGFSQRLTSMADYLRRMGRPEGWSGEAAEAFAAGVEPLEQDLRRFGEDAGKLTDLMKQYQTRFAEAKGKNGQPPTGTFELEEGARRAKSVAFEAQLAFDNRRGPDDSRALDKALTEAWDSYGAIVRRAHEHQASFEASVEDVAKAIHRLAERAPIIP